MNIIILSCFTYLCFCVRYICIHTQRPELAQVSYSTVIHPCFLRRRSFIEPEACLFNYTSWPVSSRVLPVSPPPPKPVLGFRCTLPLLGDPNSALMLNLHFLQSHISSPLGSHWVLPFLGVLQRIAASFRWYFSHPFSNHF